MAAEWARRLAAQPPMQISIVKRQLNHSYSMTMAEALEWEGVAQTAFGTSADAREAMLAFLEKREPRFTGALSDRPEGRNGPTARTLASGIGVRGCR